MKLRCKYNCWWLKWFGSRGYCFYPFLLFRDSKPEVWDGLFRHELEHAYQIREMGVISYVLSYYAENIRKGYRANKYEIRCREASLLPLTTVERYIFEQDGE